MKTPKEKADELVSKFGTLASDVVDYILNETSPDNGFMYWQQVKEELTKL